MNKKIRASLMQTALLLVLFILYTAAVIFVDVKAIGPQSSEVGFATLNGAFHDLTGVHMSLYDATDILSIIPFVMGGGFALLGLYQLIKRRSIKKIDSSILVLGGYYVIVLVAYLLFEKVTINYRPVLIEGVLEGSYPSSTTMLMLCIMPTAMMQFGRLIKNKKLLIVVNTVIGVYTAAMVIVRLISGVHWITDIIGGVLLSVALVMLYRSANLYIESRK